MHLLFFSEVQDPTSGSLEKLEIWIFKIRMLFLSQMTTTIKWAKQHLQIYVILRGSANYVCIILLFSEDDYA